MKKIVILIASLLLLCTACGKQKDPHEERMEKIYYAAAVKLEAAGQEKTIVIDARDFESFASMNILPTEGTFEEDWIYRCTAYPDSESDGIVILFGETCLSVDGVVYVAGAGSSYGRALEWVQGKYEYFIKNQLNDFMTIKERHP